MVIEVDKRDESGLGETVDGGKAESPARGDLEAVSEAPTPPGLLLNPNLGDTLGLLASDVPSESELDTVEPADIVRDARADLCPAVPA